MNTPTTFLCLCIFQFFSMACGFLWDPTLAKERVQWFFMGFNHGQNYRMHMIFHELWRWLKEEKKNVVCCFFMEFNHGHNQKVLVIFCELQWSLEMKITCEFSWTSTMTKRMGCLWIVLDFVMDKISGACVFFQ